MEYRKEEKKVDKREYKKDQDWKRQKERLLKKMIIIAVGSNLHSDTYGSPLKNCLKSVMLIKKFFFVKKFQDFIKLNQSLNLINHGM